MSERTRSRSSGSGAVPRAPASSSANSRPTNPGEGPDVRSGSGVGVEPLVSGVVQPLTSRAGNTSRRPDATSTAQVQGKPRFIHGGVLYTYEGSVFDKLLDPVLYTGSHRQRFDSFGRGRGLKGRDSYSLQAESTCGDNRNGQRWQRGLRQDFYHRAPPAPTAPAGSILLRSNSASAGAGAARSHSRRLATGSEVTTQPAPNTDWVGSGAKPEAAVPRFEAWQMNNAGEMVLDEQRTYLMNYGPGGGVAPALREDQFTQPSDLDGPSSGDEDSVAPRPASSRPLPSSEGFAAHSVGAEAVRGYFDERQAYGRADASSTNTRSQAQGHSGTFQSIPWTVSSMTTTPPMLRDPRGLTDVGKDQRLAPRDRQETERGALAQHRRVDTAVGDARALEPWERLALQRRMAEEPRLEDAIGIGAASAPLYPVKNSWQSATRGLDDGRRRLQYDDDAGASTHRAGAQRRELIRPPSLGPTRSSSSNDSKDRDLDQGWIEDHRAARPARATDYAREAELYEPQNPGLDRAPTHPAQRPEPTLDEMVALVERYQRGNTGRFHELSEQREARRAKLTEQSMPRYLPL